MDEMKKKKVSLAVLTALLLSGALIYAGAAGGDASDPLASLSYLNGSFTETVDARVNEKLDRSDRELLNAPEGTPSAAFWTEKRLKQSDTLSGPTGANVLVLAGSVQVSFSSGAVVDATAGVAVPSGTTLTSNHRYLVAEDTKAQFRVLSKTAVLNYQGPYQFSFSQTVDYNAMASALKTMHLFKGSFTGYGQGFDLEQVPTRLQALIMFIRVLGEEDAALAWNGTTPFRDIGPSTQAAHYVGYAYEKGYTNGFTATTFCPGNAISANQYTEFLLRALGYSSSSNTDLSHTLDRAVANHVITAGERDALRTGPFLRADLVYLSYYALDATLADGSGTLRNALISKGIFTAAESNAAKALVSSQRK